MAPLSRSLLRVLSLSLRICLSASIYPSLVCSNACHRCVLLNTAADKGHLECLQALLQASASASEKNEHGDTALHSAAESGHLECVQVLLQAGASVNEKNRIDYTPLHCAAERGRLECLQALLQA